VFGLSESRNFDLETPTRWNAGQYFYFQDLLKNLLQRFRLLFNLIRVMEQRLLRVFQSTFALP
jgi:hypothetical protein